MALRPNLAGGLPLSRNPVASSRVSFCEKHGMRQTGCQAESGEIKRPGGGQAFVHPGKPGRAGDSRGAVR